MKRLICVLLTLCLMAGFLPAAGLKAQAYVADDYYFDGIYEYYVLDGKAVIQSAGGASGDLVIPNTLGGYQVTGIEVYAFYQSKITSVVIPEGVTWIGNYAFRDCRNLTAVSVPNSLTSLGSDVFKGCSKLTLGLYNNCGYLGNSQNPYLILYKSANVSMTSCEIHSDAKIIATSAFDSCCNMKSVTIPSGMVQIGNYVFSGCMNLKTVYYMGSETRWKTLTQNVSDTYLQNAETVCLGASEEEEGPDFGKVDTWNLLLSDDIGVNFNFSFTDLIKNDYKSYLEVKIGDSTQKYGLCNPYTGAFADSNTTFTINVAASQMTDEINLCIVVNGVRDELGTYSVRAYADEILAGDYSNSTKLMVQYMLAYGAMAQKYFGYNEGKLANAGISCPMAEVPQTASKQFAVSGEHEGLTFYGASLCYDNKIALRFYFKADNIRNYSFFQNGYALPVVENNGLYYVEITGYYPQYLTNQTTITVYNSDYDSISVAYSPMNYIVRMYNNPSATKAAKDLLQALYTYHLAAKSYTE